MAYDYLMKTKFIRLENFEQMTNSNSWEIKLQNAVQELLNQAANLASQPSTSNWEICSHGIAPVGNHLVVSFLFRRLKEEGMI